MRKVCVRHTARAISIAVIAFMVAGCASIERLPAVSYAQGQKSEILNLPEARFYFTDTDRIGAIALKAYQRRNKVRTAAATQYYLAISGGGDDGAFGAGLLGGWSDRGDMPNFDVVTGVSTGALSAPFAFLGRDYNQQLREVYTETGADDVRTTRNIVFSVVAGDALFDSSPLRALIARHVTPEMVRKIAEEYNKGRLLFILTTNLDQGRPVIWNIGEIAASNDPKARELIINVLLASASIPTVFPPVMIDLTVDGQKLQEMHVDGGTIAQGFLYPASFSIRSASKKFGVSEQKLRTARKRVAYVIRNGRLSRQEDNVKVQTLAIATQAIATMIASSGVNDTYRMYLVTKRDGVDFNLASIGDDFTVPYKGPFDKDYMRAVFDYGYEKGRAGYHWQTTPPGYVN